jgi:hypothetical protein
MTFNLRTLLGLVTVLCVLAWLLTAAPPSVAAIGLFVYVTLQTTFFVAGAMYAGENLKAFCRGALLPGLVDYAFVAWVFIQLALAMDLDYFVRVWNGESQIVEEIAFLRRSTVVAAVMSVLIGLAMVGFKRLLEPRSQQPPSTES